MSILTTRLLNKRVAAVLSNGNVLQIRATDGSEIDIAWLDDNGLPIKGRPALYTAGARLIARGMRDIINSPQITRHGVPE